MRSYTVVAWRYAAVTSAIAVLAITAGLRVHADAGASLKIDVLRGYPVVGGVFVSGHGPFRFLVDTGSTLNHLEPKLGRSIGLAETFRTGVVSVGGVSVASGSEGVSVALGSARSQTQAFVLGGLDAVHELSSDIHGILGQAFLSQFDYRLDLKSSRLIFGGDEGTGTRVATRVIHGRPAVLTSLGWLILDSGAQSLVLYGIQAPGDPVRLTTVGGARDVGSVPRQLRIAGKTFWTGDALAVSDAVEEGVAGLLPMSFFRSVFISNSGGFVVLD